MSLNTGLSSLVLVLAISAPAFAENGSPEGGGMSGGQEPVPGTLVIPGQEQQQAGDKKKKCMTVCARWGEECTYINRGAGGTTRKCRRTCKQFTEECF